MRFAMQLAEDPVIRWDDLPEIMTVAEAATFLRISKSGVYAAIKLGILPAVNAGIRRTRIARGALQKVFAGVVEGRPSTAAFGHKLEAKK